MKKLKLITTTIFIILALAVCSWGADISNLTELKNAASSGGNFTISPATYTLDADLTFGTDITITHDDTAGDVIIDGDNSYEVAIQDCSAEFTGQSDDKRINFTRGEAQNVDISSTASATEAVFTYCAITDSNSSNGIQGKAGNADTIDMTLTDCNVYNNALDGVSFLGGTVNADMTMNLLRCEIHGNGTGASDQGVTAHSEGQIVNVDNCDIYDNTDQGIAIVGAAQGYIYNSNIPDNGGDCIEREGDGMIVIDTCNISSNSEGCVSGGAGNGLKVVQNCKLTNPSSGSSNYIMSAAGLLYVQGSIFQGSAKSSTYDIYITGGSAFISNNVFYNSYRVIRMASRNITLKNNIVYNADWFAYTVKHNAYLNNKANGYNYFYDVDHLFYDTDDSFSSSQKQSSDVAGVDPKFKDITSGDFSLQTDSPCRNAGKPTPNGGYTDIGAWQMGSEEYPLFGEDYKFTPTLYKQKD